MKQILNELKNIYRQYKHLDCFNLAAALSFYAILSILPIFLIVVSIGGYYLGESEGFLQKTGTLIESVIPSLKEGFLQNLKSLIQQKLAIGWIGILFLFFVAHFLFANLERTVNRLLHSKRKRHFLITRLLFLVWIIGIVLLLSVPSLLQLGQDLIATWGLDINIKVVLTASQWFFIISWLTFLMLIFLIPTQKIRLVYALEGGFIFAFLLQAARWLFRLYTTYYFHRYNLIYGSLTTLILGAVWIFYFSNILLLCVLWVGERQRRIAK